MTIYAERLRAELLRRGWSQAELARRAGLDPGHLSRYVNGRIRPQAANFQKLLEALEMTEEEFLAVERFEPDEGQLRLLCEVEILLGLVGRAAQGHGAIAPDAPVSRLLDATYAAMQAKVAEIRSVIQPGRAGRQA